jgi:hypothetical protein
MIFPKKYKPELIVSSDPFHKALTQPHLDKEKNAVVATDGMALAYLPVTVRAEDVAGPINVEAIKTARKSTPKDQPDLSLDVNDQTIKTQDGTSFPRARPDRDGDKFPDVSQVIPTLDESRTVHVCFNAALLLRLAEAIGAIGEDVKQKVIVLSFNPADRSAPMLVRTLRDSEIVRGEKEPFGVLMPYRFNTPNGEEIGK